jgi:hypothetical protein
MCLLNSAAPKYASPSSDSEQEPMKSRIVDLSRGESFGFLGFDFRRIRSRRGVWRAYYTPKLKKRTALLRKLKAVFRRYQSQPVDRVVQLINPILSGWVNYFAIGDSGECFAFIKDWVEKKVRRVQSASGGGRIPRVGRSPGPQSNAKARHRCGRIRPRACMTPIRPQACMTPILAIRRRFARRRLAAPGL